VEKPLTGNFRADGFALSLDEYVRHGGYQALRKALHVMTPEQVLRTVKEANLRGRGGAGFDAGLKWSLVPRGPDADKPKYVICNADEMEPGTFKDNWLLRGNPHQVIEGMLLCAYAIDAEQGYVFVRGEYTEQAARVEKALREAREAGYIGAKILETDFAFDLHMHVSAGRYMCGEETGLLNALEGRRASPRAKPPHPVVVGLWGKPTVVNNVETFANVPHIVMNGSEWFRKLSRTNEGGTKIYGVSGNVNRPGAWELPMGTTIRELLEEHAGGMRDGYTARAVIPGGASTDFVLEEDFDTPMDFERLMDIGSRLGTGTMIVLDDKTCPIGMVLNMMDFFAQESCGWCTPCREGLPWAAHCLRAIETGKGTHDDVRQLDFLVKNIGPLGNTFCALAPGAMEPLGSALRFFREEFIAHIENGKCGY
jgi:NADH-quinone oxidoreductase subunit F